MDGKTESKLLPPNPAADIIIETVERGTTLRENNCKIIDTIRDYIQSLFIVNKALYAEPATKRVVDNFTTDIEEALDARNKILVTFNVPEDANTKIIEDYLMEQGYLRPTVSSLSGGGVAIQVLVKDMTVANSMMPFLRENGAEDRITQVINTYGK